MATPTLGQTNAFGMRVTGQSGRMVELTCPDCGTKGFAAPAEFASTRCGSAQCGSTQGGAE